MTTTASNNPLSRRAEQALNLLEHGAKFVHRLERNNYTGREQFKYRLISDGHTVKGFGFSTFDELRGMLCPLNGGTTCSTYYGLPYVHTPAQGRQF